MARTTVQVSRIEATNGDGDNFAIWNCLRLSDEVILNLRGSVRHSSSVYSVLLSLAISAHNICKHPSNYHMLDRFK
ncbi:hypothetical protein WA026_019404 [Henosepilachna vigintioctopunctata]|uniref:Uncharacterized protein n=1 Tax=Henosepilachna vigintioctopunctata TaxID=420089 RepID=A0AAW1UEM1_9CUCU